MTDIATSACVIMSGCLHMVATVEGKKKFRRHQQYSVFKVVGNSGVRTQEFSQCACPLLPTLLAAHLSTLARVPILQRRRQHLRASPDVSVQRLGSANVTPGLIERAFNYSPYDVCRCQHPTPKPDTSRCQLLLLMYSEISSRAAARYLRQSEALMQVLLRPPCPGEYRRPTVGSRL